MATPEQVAQDFSGPAPSFVSAPDDFIARTLRSTASTFTPALQTTESLLGNTENAQRLADIRRDMATNQPGDLLPTNPELDNSVGATVANTIGSAAPRAALLGLTGGAGLPLLAAETLAANRTLVPEQQAQWDLASQAATTPEELAALGPRPTALSANTSGLGSLAAFALAGPALARLGTPLLANVTPALRPFAGVGLNTLTNVGADLGIQSAESAITGKPMEVTPNSLAASFTGGAIFGVHPGIEQAGAVPEFLKVRAARQQLAQLQAEAKARADAQEQADKVAQAAQVKTVTPATGAPDNVVIKTPTEDEPGVSVAPPRVVPPTNPTAELAKTNPDATLLPIAAKTVAASDTSEPKVIQTPKAEPVEEPSKTEAEQGTQTDEQRLAEISAQMRQIEDSVLGDTSELDAQTKKKYNALSDEAYELRTGQKPEKNVAAPVTGNERPDLSKAPPPFRSEEEPPPVPAEEPVTEKRTAPQLSEDLTKLTDDQLAEAELKAQGNPEAQKLIDDEYDRRATNAANNSEAPEVRTGGPEGDTGVPAGPDVPEANRGAGVPGNEGELGLGRKTADGRDIPEGLTQEEGEEYWKLFDKSKWTKAESDRLDQLTDKISDGATLANAPTTKQLSDKYGVALPDLVRINAFVTKRLAPIAQKLANAIAGENVHLEFAPTDGGGGEVTRTPDGRLVLTIDPNMGAYLRSRGLSDFRIGALAKKMLGEELIHVGQYSALRDIQSKVDPQSKVRPDKFVVDYATKIVNGLRDQLNKYRADGNQRDAGELDRAIRGAKSGYDGEVAGKMAADLLDEWSKDPAQALKYAYELDRQLHEFRISGRSTEGFRDRVLAPLHDLVVKGINAVKSALGLAERGGFGPELRELYEGTKGKLAGKSIRVREDQISQETLNGLKDLGVHYNGVQEDRNGVPRFLTFTPDDQKTGTTFTAPLKATIDQVRANRDRALLPFDERTRTNTTGLPEDTGGPNAGGGDTGETSGPQHNPPGLPEAKSGSVAPESGGATGAIRADANGIRQIPPEGGPAATLSGRNIKPEGFEPEPGGRGEGAGVPENAPEGGRVEAGDETARTGGAVSNRRGGQGVPARVKSKTFLENAFDRIKNLPIIGRVAHRLEPAVQDIRDNIISLFHGKENLSNTAANRVGDELRRAIGPNKEDQDAAYHILANGGARIGEQGVPVTPGEDATITADDVKNGIKAEMSDLQKALQNPNLPAERKAVIEKWLPSWQRALDNFDKLLPGAQKAGRAYDDAYQLRKSVDPDARYTQDYAARLYELNKERGNSPLPPESFIGNQKNGIQSFNEGRKYQSLSDALIGHQLPNGGWEGETPKSLNLPDLTANHVKVSNDIVGNKMLLDQYETTSYPGTNEPVMIPAPKEGQRLPPNYVRVAGPAGKDVFVYKPVADLFKAIWAPSAVRGSDIGNIALKAAAVAKHGTVAYDIFHPSRLIQKGLFEAIAGGKWSEAGARVKDYWRNVVVPSFGNDYIGKHLALLNVDPRDIGEYESKGYISKETADYLRSPEAEQDRRNIQDGGLLTGRFTDNLWKEAKPWLKSAADKVGLGKAVEAQEAINKFTFERLAPSMMVMAFKNRRAQLAEKFPELSQYQISRQAGKEINEQFGNIGKSGFLKSATAQDLGQIFFLAPSWVQSQVAAEARQYGQLGKAGLEATFGTKNAEGVRERNFRLGNSAKFLATTAASVFALNQAVNLVTRGQFTWQNPEKDHKFDAWIPGGKDGFFYSPLTLASEYAHHIQNYSQFESIPGAATHIASNKLSPIAQAAKVALTQKNYLGQKLTPGQTAIEAGKTLLPIPISLKSPAKAFSEGAKSGTTEQNIARTLGVQLDRAPDAVSQAYQAFQPYRKADSGDRGPSPYKDLKTMVQNGADAQTIKAEVARLNKEGHATPNIQKSFTNTFHPSGSVKGDLQGLKEHPEYKILYDKAKAQKEAEKNAFMKALQTK